MCGKLLLPKQLPVHRIRALRHTYYLLGLAQLSSHSHYVNFQCVAHTGDIVIPPGHPPPPPDDGLFVM